MPISLKYIPKQRIDGTQTAVNNPSSRWPENHRYPETVKDMATAKSIKTSDFLIITKLLLFHIS
jgi:hypothetical protein